MHAARLILVTTGAFRPASVEIEFLAVIADYLLVDIKLGINVWRAEEGTTTRPAIRYDIQQEIL